MRRCTRMLLLSGSGSCARGSTSTPALRSISRSCWSSSPPASCCAWRRALCCTSSRPGCSMSPRPGSPPPCFSPRKTCWRPGCRASLCPWPCSCAPPRARGGCRRGAANAGFPARRWGPPFAISALLCSLAALAQYSLAVLSPALALFVGVGFEQRKWSCALLFLLIAAAGVSPWVARNYMVSGRPLGLAPYEALNETALYPGTGSTRPPRPTSSRRCSAPP